MIASNKVLHLNEYVYTSQIKESGEEINKQIKRKAPSNINNNKKYEFTSNERSDNNNNNNHDKFDYVTFNAMIKLQNIEKDGFIRLVGFINEQSFKKDIPLSAVESTTKNIEFKLKVLKDMGFIFLGTPDEYNLTL